MRDLVDELLQAKVKATLFGGDHAPRLGRLVILDRLGSGAMGTVFTAYDPRLDRKVAVKLVRAGTDRERVIREARALGKLAHPNVVAIHDVGELDDEVYIVMELAPGVPLRTWIAGDREWQDVVRVMAEAAAGLAAAHRAGLVHRDIKPDNILIGDDRTRVVDFGLAQDRATGDDGLAAGTPSYMAPEVLHEQPATEASDQFSFGVTLYEALYGVRPHAGASRDELKRTARTAAAARPAKGSRPDAAADPIEDVDAVAATEEDPTGQRAKVDVAATDGRSSAPRVQAGRSSATNRSTAGRAVRTTPPSWLHAIVVRALAAEPAKRFPSMDALVTALGRDRRRRNRAIGLATGAALIGASVAVFAMRGSASVADPCDGGPARRASVWSPEIQARVRSSLGSAAWTSSSIAALEATASHWEASYRKVCEATRVAGAQSDTLLDLRMRCLDRSLDRFGALATALSAPLDTPARTEATGAILDLPPPAACETLDDPAELALPADPAIRAKVTAAEKQLDRAWAAYSLGHYSAAADVLRDLGAAKLLGAPALTAAVLVLDAAVVGRIGKPAEARALLDDALAASAVAHTAELDVEIWARMLRHELFTGSSANVAEWAPFAFAAAARAGHGRAELEGILGEALRDAGKLDEAREHLRAALANPAELRSDQRALVEMNIGSVELAAGAPGAAEAAFTRARELARSQLGDGHPTLALYDDKLAAAARARGRIRDALVLSDHSVGVRTQAYGARDRSVATSLLHRARTLLEANRIPEARKDAETALDIRAQAFGGRSPRLGEVQALRGDIEVAAGRLEDARLHYRNAGELDPRLDLLARRAAAGEDVSSIDLPTTIDPLTVDRGAALAATLGKQTHDAARPLATELKNRVLAIGPPVDPALALPVGEMLLLIGDSPGATAIARTVLGQLADEPSRARDRAQRLLDAALK